MGTTKSDKIDHPPLDLARAIELSDLDPTERAILLGLLNYRDILTNVIINACAGLTEWPDWVNIAHVGDQVSNLVRPHLLKPHESGASHV